MLMNASDYPPCGKIVDSNHCRGLTALLKNTVHLFVAGTEIILSPISNQTRVYFQSPFLQALLIFQYLFISRKYIHPASHDGNLLMPERKKMLHHQFHGLHGVDPYGVALGSVQLTCNNHRRRGHHIIHRLHIFHTRYQFICMPSQKDNGVHPFVQKTLQKFFFQLHIPQKIV